MTHSSEQIKTAEPSFSTHPHWVAPDDFDPDLIPEGFQDSSYCNDETPCYSFNNGNEITVFLSLADKGSDHDFDNYCVYITANDRQIGDCTYFGKSFKQATDNARTVKDIINIMSGV